MTRRQMDKLKLNLAQAVVNSIEILSEEELDDLTFQLARFADYFEDKHLVTTNRVIKKKARI